VYLVRGKTGYRVTGGELNKNLYFDFNDKKKVVKVKKMFLLIEQLLIKDYPDKFIFDFLINFTEEIEKNAYDLFKIEIFYIVKLLNHFGYFDETDMFHKIEDLSDQMAKQLVIKINLELKKIAF
jgi:hypothetical protein